MTTTHLDALHLRLSHERVRLANAKSKHEIEMRKVWVSGIEKEIAQERDFLGMPDDKPTLLTDDDLLAALTVL